MKSSYNVRSRIDTGLRKKKYRNLTESEKSSVGNEANFRKSLNDKKKITYRRNKSKSPISHKRKKTPTKGTFDRSLSKAKKFQDQNIDRELSEKYKNKGRAKITKIKTSKSRNKFHQQDNEIYYRGEEFDGTKEKYEDGQKTDIEAEEEKLELEALEKKKQEEELKRIEGFNILENIEKNIRKNQREDFIQILKCISREYEIQLNFAMELRNFSLKRSFLENLKKCFEIMRWKKRLLKNFCVIFNHNLAPKIRRDFFYSFKKLKKVRGRPFSRIKKRNMRRLSNNKSKYGSKSPSGNNTNYHRNQRPSKSKIRKNYSKNSLTYKSKASMKTPTITPDKTEAKDIDEEINSPSKYASKREKAKAYDKKNRKRNISNIQHKTPKGREQNTFLNDNQINCPKTPETRNHAIKNSPLQNTAIMQKMGKNSVENSLRNSQVCKNKYGQDSVYNGNRPSPKFENSRTRSPIGPKDRYKTSRMSPSSGAPSERIQFSSHKKYEEESECISTEIRKS